MLLIIIFKENNNEFYKKRLFKQNYTITKYYFFLKFKNQQKKCSLFFECITNHCNRFGDGGIRIIFVSFFSSQVFRKFCLFFFVFIVELKFFR